jgi:hypothetical protein
MSDKPQQVPAIGRVVHFVYGSRHIPAIITDPAFEVAGYPTDKIKQALTVFPVGEPPFTTIANYDEHCISSTWHWPEYVPAKA